MNDVADPSIAQWAEQRAAVVEAARTLTARGLNRGTSGNVSRRVPGGMLVTPSGMTAEALTPGDMVFVDIQGRPAGRWKPSSEWRFHHDIYRARDDIAAVLHTHSIHATALAICGERIPAVHYMVAAAGGHAIECADYALFGTQALSDAVLEALGNRLACLMANHGMIACGPSLDRAVWLAEEIETLAEQYVTARHVGTPRLLDAARMDAVLARFAGYGQQAAADAAECGNRHEQGRCTVPAGEL